MDLIADILLVAGALGAAFYCFILGRRLRKFNDLEKGVGGAVAVLSGQVDDLSKTLASAQRVATMSTDTLTETTERAERTAKQLELLMASLHDVPTQPASPPPTPVAEVIEPVASPPEPPKEVPNSEPMFVRHSTAMNGASQ